MTNKKSIIKFTILIIIIAGAFFAFRYTPLSQYTQKEVLLNLLAQLREHWWGPVGFIIIYGVGCVVAFPGSILTLCGGAIFGVAWGTFYNVLASNLGATLAFLMARYFGRDFVSRFMKGRVESFDEKVAKHGFRFIFTLRLIPLVPFNGLNLGSGLSRIKYRDYLLGSVLGMIPGTFIYTYFADALLSGVTGTGQKALTNLIIASVLLILISLVPTIYKKLKRNEKHKFTKETKESNGLSKSPLSPFNKGGTKGDFPLKKRGTKGDLIDFLAPLWF